MSKDNVVEVLLSSGGQGRVWESRPGKWSWAHPNGSDGCGCEDQSEAEAELQECEQPTPDDGTVTSCQQIEAAYPSVESALADYVLRLAAAEALADKLAEALKDVAKFLRVCPPPRTTGENDNLLAVANIIGKALADYDAVQR